MTAPARRLATVLDRLCRARGISNVELGKCVGVSHSYIQQLRKGTKVNPALFTVLAIADRLAVHPACFVGGRQDRAPGALSDRPFADKLNRLFQLVHPAGQEEFSANYIINAIRARGEELGDRNWTISASTLADLRSGRNPNPGLIHILALAEPFGADPAYFFDEELAARVDEQLQTHLAMASLGVDTVILRASEQVDALPPQILKTIRENIVRALTPREAGSEQSGEPR